MKKYLVRNEQNANSDDDPYSATKKTLVFKKQIQEPIINTKFQIIEKENLIKNENNSKLKTADNKHVKSLSHAPNNKEKKLESNSIMICQEPSKYREKLASIKHTFEIEKGEYKQLSAKINLQSRRVNNARKTLANSQQELQKIIDEQSKNYKVVEKFSQIGEISAKMAHDIRSPLTIIKSQIELMKLRYAKNEDIIMLESLERMERAIKSITWQINDVLEFLKDSESSMTKCNVQNLLNDAINDLHVPDGIQIILPESQNFIFCDEVKTKSIFSNIILNAIQAIGEKGTIRIFVRETQDMCIIDIEDSGPGIPDADLEKIFEPLFTTKVTGTGLGLSRCRQILRKQGGTIQVKNSPTTFSIGLRKSN